MGKKLLKNTEWSILIVSVIEFNILVLFLYNIPVFIKRYRRFIIN